MLLLVTQNILGLPRGFSSLQRMTLTPLIKPTCNFYLDSRKLTNPCWQELLSTPIQQWSSSAMRLIAENNNLPAQNHYFQATNEDSSEVQSLVSCIAKLLWAAGTRVRLVWIFVFFYNFRNLFLLIGAGEKSRHLHFSSLRKTEESNQYIFQFSLGSTDWSCSSKLNWKFKTSKAVIQQQKFQNQFQLTRKKTKCLNCFRWHSQKAENTRGEKQHLSNE